MPLERSVFVDNAGDARGGIGTDDGGVFVSSDEESLFVVVIVAFSPKPEIRICGTSFGEGEEPFTPLELRKFPGDDDAADFPYDSDILFCTDDDNIIGFGDDENAAVAKPELIFQRFVFISPAVLLYKGVPSCSSSLTSQKFLETFVCLLFFVSV